MNATTLGTVKLMVRQRLKPVYQHRSLLSPMGAIWATRRDIYYGAPSKISDLPPRLFTLSKAWHMKLLVDGVDYSVTQS